MTCVFLCCLFYNVFYYFFFFFNDTATTQIYTLSLHDALPIYLAARPARKAPRSGHLALSAEVARGARPRCQIREQLAIVAERHELRAEVQCGACELER